jgi:hypothetical protein
VRTCTSRTSSACWAGWVLVHRPQEHWNREVLDVVVHTGTVHGCRLGTVVTTRPSRGRVSAVLGAVNASARCADRYAASGIDRASAQLRIWPLRDGRREANLGMMVEFDLRFARAYSVNISSVPYGTPSASHPVHVERVFDPRPRARSNATKRSSARCSFTAGVRTPIRTSERARDSLLAALVLRTGAH